MANLDAKGHPYRALALLDLDGTLTQCRKPVTGEMLDFLQKLRRVVKVGIVSGSDEAKVKQQLGPDANDLVDFLFVENGVVAYQGRNRLPSVGAGSIATHIGEQKLANLINFVLKYFSELDIPVKRGTFIEYRTGMLNFSPIGRNCTYEERLAFNEFDRQTGTRRRFVDALQNKFDDYGLQFSIGGQISVDCFPTGWDKTYCLRFLENDFDVVHFFGDQTNPGGNDFEIYEDKHVVGHRVTGPEDTLEQLKRVFKVA